MVVLKKMYRSTRDKKIIGLCGGLAEMLNVDVTLLRILLIIVTVITGGGVILVYLLAGLVVPKEPPIYSNFGPNGYGNGYGGGYNPGYGHQPNTPFGGPYKNPPQAPVSWNTQGPTAQQPTSTQFDSMMDDLEKKALRREIEELKAKIAKYEKGDF
ncbi:PspC domain-containing protein [Paenibacillus sp. LHD-38]|uniref:PspC domain-containing protein n=1 Tax=Paenibacillus sp. LHD-38 TaxID=3072143 RepID=UPI0028100271|nr:PspC domain-containing protein [Paenibacillus sp. LHD-38]MDQ8739296.1 PspC domain-containing protein [Paenibacillus sp. LHD-38]